MSSSDSKAYKNKKAFFDKLLTIYGRKPVLEALNDPDVTFHKVHLAESNKAGGIIAEIIERCESRNIPIHYHDKKALSRISKNSKQDQGVAADLAPSGYTTVDAFIEANKSKAENLNLLALDRITNPQNLGMIIRSACAGHIDGLILPKEGCATISPLVIKASAGTAFKATIINCDSLPGAITSLSKANIIEHVYSLKGDAKQSLFDQDIEGNCLFILGNETDGVSDQVQALCTDSLCIPMNNGVESLNVAITAALIAFYRR